MHFLHRTLVAHKYPVQLISINPKLTQFAADRLIPCWILLTRFMLSPKHCQKPYIRYYLYFCANFYNNQNFNLATNALKIVTCYSVLQLLYNFNSK